MATTTRPSSPQPANPPTPTRTEPFPRINTSLSAISGLPPVTEEPEDSNILRPIASQKLAPVASHDPLSKADHRGLSPRLSSVPLTGVAAMADLKRRKQQTLPPPPAALSQQHNHQQSQSPKSVHASSRQTTPNPAVRTLEELMGGGGISRPTDAPAPDKLSEPMRRAAEKIHLSDTSVQTDSGQASPVSLGSLGTVESSNGAGGAMTATTNQPTIAEPQFVAEPAQMTDGRPPRYTEPDGEAEQGGNKAFSYPGPQPPTSDHAHPSTPMGAPVRGMSLPGYGQSSPRSPVSSNKRHKCPYCSTDFTRHHNLKSHLLTHSQEKPFVCQTCQARFRRLHDLKRHTKLHTGERPHECDKCGRKFARGDALARHNKGPGGCAGRRGSFGGDDEYSGDGAGPDMDGVEYVGHDDDDDGIESPDGRSNDSSRKRQQLETPADSERPIYRPHSSTYPPATSRSMGAEPGGMGPPPVIHSAANTNPPNNNSDKSPRHLSPMPGAPPNANNPTSGYYSSGQMFSEPGAMTSSPKPLSPGQPPDQQHRLSVPDTGRNRSVSLNTQFARSHVSSLPGDATRPGPAPNNPPFSASQPPGASSTILPPLNASSLNASRPGTTSQQQQQGQPPQPPPIIGGPGLTHPQQQIQLTPGNPNPNSNDTRAAGPSSQPGSLSSHGRSSGSSIRDLIGHDNGDLWQYVRQLEQRFHRMQDEYELRIARLQEDVISLKGQVAAAAASNHHVYAPSTATGPGAGEPGSRTPY